MGGHRKRLIEPHRALVIERLKAVPDITMEAMVAELAERGIATCPVSVGRMVRSESMNLKKAVCDRAGSTGNSATAQWQKYQGRLDRLILVAWSSST